MELSREEWTMLENVEEVLRAVLRATLVLSGRRFCTIGVGYFAIIHLKEYLEDQNERSNLQLNRLKQLLLAQFKNYFDDNGDQMNMLKVSVENISLIFYFLFLLLALSLCLSLPFPHFLAVLLALFLCQFHCLSLLSSNTNIALRKQLSTLTLIAVLEIVGEE